MMNKVRITIALLICSVVLCSVSALAADTETPKGSSGDLFDLALEVSQTSSCPPGQDCSSPTYCSENPGSQYCAGTNAGAPVYTSNPGTNYMRGQSNAAILDPSAFNGMEISGDTTFTPPTHTKKFVGLCCW